MRAHLVQFDIAWEQPAENLATVRGMLDGARPSPGDLVVLPEMFSTGFSFNLARTADTDSGTLRAIAGLARQARVTVHGSRAVLGPDGKGRNLATIAGPEGSILAEYAKVHPFSFGKETDHFAGGETVVCYPWRGPGETTTVCAAICYDLRFPELFRLGLLSGAEVLALGANWPAPRAAHWRALLIARAIENQAFALGVNRCGSDPHLAYAGGSIAVGPRGEVLGELGAGPGVLSVELDFAALRSWRAVFPAWRDARLIGR
ncbi:MAG TPA: nitrilase-related carbon-nitrogen hydrolase [Phycisphaerales bacterium]|nr:nitrilase-related carbon-nitrogen hydrolase [Phycisphaerales bacterium]